MRRGAKVRLFVAVELPAPLRAELADWTRAALGDRDGVRRVGAAALHVTLAFLGGRPASEIDVIAAAVLDCGAGALARQSGVPSEVELGAPAWLPSRRPRVLAIELRDGFDTLGLLQRDVATALAEAIGYEPERRRFRPHVTVARIAARQPPGPRELPPTPAAAFEPVALTLYRSQLNPGGAVYEPLARAELWPARLPDRADRGSG